MTYIERVEKDINIMLNSKIQQYIESKHAETMEAFNKKQSEIKNLKSSIESLKSEISSKTITIETTNKSSTQAESAEARAAEIEVRIK